MYSNKNYNLSDSLIKAARQAMTSGSVALTKVEAELFEAKKKKMASKEQAAAKQPKDPSC